MGDPAKRGSPAAGILSEAKRAKRKANDDSSLLGKRLCKEQPSVEEGSLRGKKTAGGDLIK